MAEEISCAQCAWRAKYDANPKSILGRIWKWHSTWCPGWKKYLESLDPEEREGVLEKYR